jgi:alpha-tubulin suppressor-like RCC1 family protein
VAAGLYFSTALLSNGTVEAWGFNSSGQLGDGTTTESHVPVTVSGLTGVKGLSAGWMHVVALMSTGSVVAWGSNLNGRLGDGGTADSSIPVAVSGLSGVKSISAGGTFSLARS